MRNVGTKKAEFMKNIDKISVKFEKGYERPGFIPADECLMSCVLNTGVIIKSVHVYATVELKGELTCGQMVVDWRGKLNKEKNVTIVTEMDQKLYEACMYKAFDASPPE